MVRAQLMNVSLYFYVYHVNVLFTRDCRFHNRMTALMSVINKLDPKFWRKTRYSSQHFLQRSNISFIGQHHFLDRLAKTLPILDFHRIELYRGQFRKVKQKVLSKWKSTFIHLHCTWYKATCQWKWNILLILESSYWK